MSRVPRTLEISAVLLLAALAAWLVTRDAEEPAAVRAPADGRGWVEGLEGSFGVARAVPPSHGSGVPGGGLGAIGYAAGTEAPRTGETGVTRLDAARAQPGVNLLVSGDLARAELRALDGALLHAWEVPYSAHADLPPLEGAHQIPWRRVALLDDGGLIAIHDGRALVRVSRDSDVEFAVPIRAHHDLVVEGDRVHVLTRGLRHVPRVDPGAPVVDDRITTLDLAGNVLHEISLWRAFLASDWADMVDRLTVRTGDVMHTNTLERLDGALAERAPAFAAGNWLVCFRDLDLLAVVDPELERLVWVQEGPWRGPHHPTVTPRGTLLVFDNLGNDGDSRLLELDPGGEIVWSWSPPDPADFSTLFCGVADPLANGNVLVTETCRGRAFELTREGEIVWEYRSPRRLGEREEFVAALFEVQRLPADAPGVVAALEAD